MSEAYGTGNPDRAVRTAILLVQGGPVFRQPMRGSPYPFRAVTIAKTSFRAACRTIGKLQSRRRPVTGAVTRRSIYATPDRAASPVQHGICR